MHRRQRQATRRWMRRSLRTDNQQHDHEDEADGDDQDTKTHPDRDGRQITVVGLGQGVRDALWSRRDAENSVSI
ncbi:hypothetical protein KQX54_020521 [Cotesia glomerata]|uniref:Uncharacterized protein n=1 Tax=Cotesia glomerata TaxID=32391 RepID=A0AAV7J8P6_COTGL|nr:hypothetical protein KQX54_020521 [Cotesia glomerata]